MPGRLIRINKNPGVRPIWVGENFQQLVAKFVLKVAVKEAKEACGTDKLCGWMEAVIEGGIHVMRLLWQQYAQEEYWGFLLIDA